MNCSILWKLGVSRFNLQLASLKTDLVTYIHSFIHCYDLQQWPRSRALTTRRWCRSQCQGQCQFIQRIIAQCLQFHPVCCPLHQVAMSDWVSFPEARHQSFFGRVSWIELTCQLQRAVVPPEYGRPVSWQDRTVTGALWLIILGTLWPEYFT